MRNPLRPTQARSLGHAVWIGTRRVLTASAWALIAAGGANIAADAGIIDRIVVAPDREQVDTLSPERLAEIERATTVSDLLRANPDCYQGDAPASMRGMMPQRSILTLNGRTGVYGARATRNAEQQSYGDLIARGIDVHAFCANGAIPNPYFVR